MAVASLAEVAADENVLDLNGLIVYQKISGLSVHDDLEAFLRTESISFLKKPFTVNYLMNKVESLMC